MFMEESLFPTLILITVIALRAFCGISGSRASVVVNIDSGHKSVKVE